MRVLVIGCGSIGTRHLKNLVSLGIDDLAVYDPVISRSERAKLQYGANSFRSLEEAIESDVDVAFITTPSHLHVPIALQAARAGCHLFIEKPLSHTEEGINELVKIVNQNHLVTMVGCNMRFHPGPKQVKNLIIYQAIGQPIAARIQAGSYLPGWRPQQDYRDSYSASTDWGGAILDCIHEIDLALWYFGDARLISSASVPAKSIGLETDGLAEFLLLHESGVLSSIHLNFVQRDYRRCCQIIGSEGTIYWDFLEHEVKVYGKNGDLERIFPGPEKWSINQMYIDEIEYFLSCLKTKSQSFNSLSDGKRTLKLALEARTVRYN